MLGLGRHACWDDHFATQGILKHDGEKGGAWFTNVATGGEFRVTREGGGWKAASRSWAQGGAALSAIKKWKQFNSGPSREKGKGYGLKGEIEEFNAGGSDSSPAGSGSKE